MRKSLASVFTILLIFAHTPSVASELSPNVANCNLFFDGHLANESVQFQTSLGPRIPGSNSSMELRESIKSNLSGWEITESNHNINGMNLTNMFATWNSGMGNTVMFAAHYDTRYKADQDPNISNRGMPVPGANDGASGVAILMELSRHIPQMNLSHEVTLFFTDAEDQGDNHSTYVIGAKAWADNLSEDEAKSIQSFILVDMVGDEFLDLRKTRPGNSTLWERTEQIIRDLAVICQKGDTSYFDFEKVDGIYDDHVPALDRGIPAIDIIDTRFGENASYLGGYWHTIEDTPDKVSAESLHKVGLILEYGLRNGSWLEVRQQSASGSEDSDIDYNVDCSDNMGDILDNCDIDETTSTDNSTIYVNLFFFASYFILVSTILGRKLYADYKGRGEIRAPHRDK